SPSASNHETWKSPPSGVSPSQFTALRTASYCSGSHPPSASTSQPASPLLLRRNSGQVRPAPETGSIGSGRAVRAVPRARVGAARGDAHLRPHLHVADRGGRGDRL